MQLPSRPTLLPPLLPGFSPFSMRMLFQHADLETSYAPLDILVDCSEIVLLRSLLRQCVCFTGGEGVPPAHQSRVPVAAPVLLAVLLLQLPSHESPGPLAE